MLLLLGAPTRAVMDAMGWSEASMARKYQHITDELFSGIADQVSGHYWPDSDDGNEDDDGSAPVPARASQPPPQWGRHTPTEPPGTE